MKFRGLFRLPAIGSALSLALPCTPLHATEMKMQCQQSRSDGRILVANGDMLPTNAHFKILAYKPVKMDEDWTEGPCTIRIFTGPRDHS